MRVPAANEIPFAGAGHRVTVFRVVHQEDLAPAELQASVGAVILELPACLAPPARERDRVAEVVPVYEMQRQSHGQRRAQGLRADEVTAVEHRLRALIHSRAHRGGEWIGAVVAIGDDANSHVRNSVSRFFRYRAE